MPTPRNINRLQLDDVSPAWTRVGDDSPTPLLFLHGLGDSSIMTFGPISRHPALGGRAAILVDLPGFGYSSAPEYWPGAIEDHAAAVLALLHEQNAGPVTIVGHSMGASLALMVATLRPSLVERLILAEPLLVREHSELARAIAKRRESDFVERGYGMLLLATERRANRGDRAAQGFLEPLQRADPAILHRSAVSLLTDRSPSFLEMLAGLAVPKVLLVGERTGADLSVVPGDIPLGRIPDAGHSMMSENPDAFARAIAAHLPSRESR